MRKFVFVSLILCLAIATTACGKRTKLEACTIVDIEKPEAQVEIGDVDVEGGEVEMVCGDKIVDVPWSEFKKRLKLNPKSYIGKTEDLRKQVSCLKDKNSKEQLVSCSVTSNAGQYESLKFNFDD